MKYKLLGRSGLRVSELCLGCTTFGTNWGPTWGVDQNKSRQIFDVFTEAGGNFLDTSNFYQESQSEQFLGEFIYPNRDRLVIGSKYSLFDGGADKNDPNASGNHRKNLARSVEGSLKRLKTDYIDLLWIHIQDHTTPVDEILRALDDLVRQGKILYIGASNFPAWWLARANTLADCHGWSPFIATQVEWSILERSCEPEFLPMAHELDMAMVCWGALAGGMATGKYNRKPDPNQPYRLADQLEPGKKVLWHDAYVRDLAIMDQVVKIADRIGRPASQIALRWLMQQKVVTIPIFSAHTVEQAKENLGACDFSLTDEEMRQIDQATLPAIASVMPNAGPYPYPMLEYGSPSLAELFYSRVLLFGNGEYKILNHRRAFPYRYQPAGASAIPD